MSIISVDDLKNQVRALAEEANPAPSEEAPPEEASPAAPAAPWNYGPSSTVVRESNFISDESLLLWLAQKQEGLYGELGDHMDLSRMRSKVVEDMSHLKEQIDAGADSGELIDQMNALLEAYAGTPFEKDLNELIGPMRDTLEAYPATVIVQPHTKPMSDAIQTKIDALGRDDQLELISIQSLTADIREAGQLASNLVASSNQTSNAIVGNIGR